MHCLAGIAKRAIGIIIFIKAYPAMLQQAKQNNEAEQPVAGTVYWQPTDKAPRSRFPHCKEISVGALTGLRWPATKVSGCG